MATATFLCCALLSACASFRADRIPAGPPLYEASLAQFERGKWSNAIQGFERLTLELPARDSLLPRAHYYLGMARRRNGEQLLAAQSFTRLVSTFPGDTLSDDALFEAGAAYADLWRKPELDPQYGESALDAFRTLLSEYPSSPRAADAQREIDALQEMRAGKDYETGDFYFRRRLYDSAIIYFLDVVERFPETRAARAASLRMLEAYRRISYAEEAREVCASLRLRYPDDREVQGACPAEAPPPAAVAPAAGTPPPG